jgi:anaerobic magnesium-protoporphyrin IX monomethyl ester cyclase
VHRASPGSHSAAQSGSIRILLIHPLGYDRSRAGHDISRIANIMPPLGLASIAAYLGKKGLPAEIVDCYAKPDAERWIRDLLQERNPGFIGFSATTSGFLDGVRLARMAKAVLPQVKVVFGGHHVSALKERILREFPVVDFTVIGEGEETLAELLEHDAEDLAGVRGLTYRDRSGEVVFTGQRTPGLDLDTLPFPAYEKLDGYPDAYRLPIFNYPRTPNTSCIASRGCPYACTYCDRSVFLRTFRYNSAPYLYEHLRYLKERFGLRHVNFYDDQFTFNRKRIEQFARRMIDRPLGMTFNCAVRAEHIDPDLLALMKQAGCWMISLGIESGDETLLSRHRQNADLDLLKERIHLIKEAGIRVKGLMMMGLPGESEGSIRKSMEFVFSLPIDDINVSKFTPFPGSPLYERIHELGTFDEDWEKMDCMHFVFLPKGMTRAEMEKLFVGFYRSHFMRPGVLADYVSMAWRSPDSWRRFLCHLPHFVRFAKTDRRIAGVPEDLTGSMKA